ncbi:MAG: aspartate-semialdehyde dehydrogenase [Salibacteraceae bacterium]
MRIAVVGATGMVGSVMLKVLAERSFPITEIYCVASEKSVGQEISFGGMSLKVIGIAQALSLKPEIAIFSAGGTISKEWAPKFTQVGTTVIDNSSAWRLDPTIKLVVPEINGAELSLDDKIIANPNCSTIQMVLALKAIHENYGIERIVVSTYQSVSGTGAAAIGQMEAEREKRLAEMVYPYPIDMNCLPHGGDFREDGYTTEEQKLVDETRKILNDQSIQVTATVVRVPVRGGHSESVNVETKKPFDLSEVKRLIAQTDGITLQDIPQTNTYPMPLYAEGKNDVFVGRIRRDATRPNALNMWVVSDNLRKGAATNAVQIAELVKELRG